MGPHIWNFKDICSKLQEGQGLITVTDVISGSHILLADRFKVLRNLYRMFCQNPSLENEGNASVSDDNI